MLKFFRPYCLTYNQLSLLRMYVEAYKNVKSLIIERFSFECRKVIGFALTMLRDWLKELTPLFHPIRSKTKTNRDSLIHIFLHFASATCNYFVIWLVHLIICVVCDWLEWLLWLWFYDTQLKTALSENGDLSFLLFFFETLPKVKLHFENNVIKNTKCN